MERLRDTTTKNRRKTFLAKRLRLSRAAAQCASLASIIAIAVLTGTQALPVQHNSPSQRTVIAFVEHARRDARTGTSVPVPPEIAGLRKGCDEKSAQPCGLAGPDQMRAFQFAMKKSSRRVLAIQSFSEPQCSPTGNCSFWVLRRLHGKYATVLDIGMVQTFGFLKSETHGYPDLVTWSHGSATERGGRFFRFDGHEYRESLSWEEDYEIVNDDGSPAMLTTPRISFVDGDGNPLPR
jgi:hypothetical protein